MKIKLQPEVYWPVIKGIAFVLLFLLLSLLSGCEKDDIIDYHYEQVIIDLDKSDYYFYSDSYNPERGWVEYWNGDYKYYFEVEGSTVTLHPTQSLISAEYLRSTMDKDPVKLEISGKNSVQKSNVTKDGVFRLIY